MKIGDTLPQISVDVTPRTKPGADQLDLPSLKGHPVVIYFYPKDNTPGCTTEAQDFAEHYEEFKSMQTKVYGVSRDGLRSHNNFKTKYDLPFELISDPDEKLCQHFGVIKLKKLYGKEHMGIERSTFLFDPSGKLVKIWSGVKVKDHVAEVLEAVKTSRLVDNA
ncbi:peroxiredoxin [Allohahella marinimesophila]|uniref:thioredoxin-dependent peroxiredoxin n=1 Tax=Allohahella marinimesophila TaxID=1054972 RepID=A0ABP7NQ35_9GAMM